MFVKMLTGLAGPGRSHIFGEVVEFDDEEGQRFIDAGLAVESEGPATNPTKPAAKDSAAKPAAKKEKTPAKMNLAELIEFAKSLGIQPGDGATKAQLLEAILAKTAEAQKTAEETPAATA